MGWYPCCCEVGEKVLLHGFGRPPHWALGGDQTHKAFVDYIEGWGHEVYWSDEIFGAFDPGTFSGDMYDYKVVFWRYSHRNVPLSYINPFFYDGWPGRLVMIGEHIGVNTGLYFNTFTDRHGMALSGGDWLSPGMTFFRGNLPLFSGDIDGFKVPSVPGHPLVDGVNFVSNAAASRVLDKDPPLGTPIVLIRCYLEASLSNPNNVNRPSDEPTIKVNTAPGRRTEYVYHGDSNMFIDNPSFPVNRYVTFFDTPQFIRNLVEKPVP